MRQNVIYRPDYFFTTSPLPCPYLPGRVERRLVTELVGRQASHLHDALSRAGFRRSHNIAYVPVCPGCEACLPVRVDVEAFRPSRTQRRIRARNAGLRMTFAPAVVTEEHFALFSVYLHARHAGGDMTEMDFRDFQMMVEDSPIETALAEFRDSGDRLIGACLTDVLGDGLSAVYSYYDVSLPSRSLGTHVVLALIEAAKAAGRPYVYLGYLIAETRKMSYKAAFRPLEALTPEGWKVLAPRSP